jgi:hypothetical protein
VERRGKVRRAAAGEPDDGGFCDALRVFGLVGVGVVDDAQRCGLDAELGEVLHAHLLPPRHHVGAFLRT